MKLQNQLKFTSTYLCQSLTQTSYIATSKSHIDIVCIAEITKMYVLSKDKDVQFLKLKKIFF